MTAEWAQVWVSAGIGLLQCGLIGWGLSLMGQSNTERRANTDMLQANTEVLRANAEIVVGFVRRTERGGVRISIDPPLALPRGGDREADAAAGMALLARALERGIRESPEQWFALHPVWDDSAEAAPAAS